jgi:hypothetical protein
MALAGFRKNTTQSCTAEAAMVLIDRNKRSTACARPRCCQRPQQPRRLRVRGVYRRGESRASWRPPYTQSVFATASDMASCRIRTRSTSASGIENLRSQQSVCRPLLFQSGD